VNQPELWIEAFYPTVDLGVAFEGPGTNQQSSTIFAEYGNMLKPSMCEYPPAIQLNFTDPDALYTLIFFDLDSIHSNVESKTVFLHWAVVNINGSDMSTGIEVSTLMFAVNV
jgi:phosphatidylethanolamine-binding protein (PEBP) family uncharacterized protein